LDGLRLAVAGLGDYGSYLRLALTRRNDSVNLADLITVPSDVRTYNGIRKPFASRACRSREEPDVRTETPLNGGRVSRHMKRTKKTKTTKTTKAKKVKDKAKPTKRAKKKARTSTKKNEIDLVSTVGILNTLRIQECLDAIEARENVAWSDTPEGTKLFEEIHDELYEIRGWSLLQEIMEAAFRHSGKENEALAKKKRPDDEEN
jgi:hypothetical protein